ncbi:MAG TPA: spore germination protein, partial [Bacilli bacterium]
MSLWNKFRKKTDGLNRSKNEEMARNTSIPPLHHDLKTNLNRIKQEVGNSPDVVIREFAIGSPQVQVAVVFIDNMIDKKLVDDFVMRSLMIDIAGETFRNKAADKNVFDFIKDNALAIGEIKVTKDWNGLMLSILSGDTVILVNGWAKAINGNTRGGKSRSVEEPSSQVVIRGPKEGFTESIGTNVSLVRRRIKSPNLWMEGMKIGNVTQTDVVI